MQFVYLILAHKGPSQLRDLVNTLQDGDNYFFIHVDRKSEMSPFLKENFVLPERVCFCENRIKVEWGAFSQIEATMELIHALQEKKTDYDYVHLLSGQDFPLQANKKIKQFFQSHKGQNFMDFFSLPYRNWSGNGGMDRISYIWMINELGLERAYELVERQKQKGVSRTFPEGISPYGGSQWWSLTKECIDYVARTCIPENILYEFYRYTYVPDEMLFQTLLLNSEFKSSIVNNNLRYINWEKGPEYPRIFRIEDEEQLKSSGKIYARKFDDGVDMQIREAIKSSLGF